MVKRQQDQNSFQRVFADIADLCELQWQLLSVDGQEAKRRAVKAAVLLALSGIVAFCGLVAAAIGCGWLLHERFDLPLSAALFIASVSFLALAGTGGWLGARQLGKANESLAETKREFAENVRWIRSVILKPRTSPRNQLRREDFPTETAVRRNGFPHLERPH